MRPAGGEGGWDARVSSSSWQRQPWGAAIIPDCPLLLQCASPPTLLLITLPPRSERHNAREFQTIEQMASFIENLPDYSHQQASLCTWLAAGLHCLLGRAVGWEDRGS